MKLSRDILTQFIQIMRAIRETKGQRHLFIGISYRRLSLVMSNDNKKRMLRPMTLKIRSQVPPSDFFH